MNPFSDAALNASYELVHCHCCNATVPVSATTRHQVCGWRGDEWHVQIVWRVVTPCIVRTLWATAVYIDARALHGEQGEDNGRTG